MRILITGGAGFIGSNLANSFLETGDHVTIVDNLSRPRTDYNLNWLQQNYPHKFRFIKADVRDQSAMRDIVEGNDAVYHLAAQVAVTTSVKKPYDDFEINALGTLSVLEAARQCKKPPAVIFASTNKVYGGMEDVVVAEAETRYIYKDKPFGNSELQPLDFHSPYGCSKGAADQYVRDYARIYGLKTVVFRMSCIYGPHQFGVEDQGWAAHFVIAAFQNKPITIYGDGKQIRDMLYIDDLIVVYRNVLENIDQISGKVYNIGGGPDNTLSVWVEFYPILEKIVGHNVPFYYDDWRPGDQKVYISDIRKAKHELGWSPKVSVEEGISRLAHWVSDNTELFN